MTPKSHFLLTLVSVFFLLSAACDDEDKNGDVCDRETQEGCAPGLVCETIEGSEEPGCFSPVHISGRVFDLTDDSGVAGALVLARDENGAALGRVTESDAEGNYQLQVPATRLDEAGALKGEVLTLRVDATGYESYPGGYRPPLPVDLDDATKTDEEGGPLIVQTPNTDVALIPLPEERAENGIISGLVPRGPGALIVAEGSDGVFTGVADADGSYHVLNVPEGSYTLRAYKGGQEYDTVAVDVTAGQLTADADFTAVEGNGATITGKVEIVNAPGDAKTSVVLVVESTFQENFARGEVPPGLRVGDITGPFTIEGVPSGDYVVLAGFENDGMVRDPDTSIGGTDIVRISAAGSDIDITEGFKVTEALETKSPGAEAPEAVQATPIFSWKDDSGEDAYEVVVFDSYGQLIWEDKSLGKISGSQWVTLEYAGPALETGKYYQWRATSFHRGTPISQTEDLRGLFYLGQ